MDVATLAALVVGTLIVVTLSWVLGGLTTVKTGSTLAVYRFGELNRKADPGLNILLPGIDEGESYTTATQQDELPAEQQEIDSGARQPYRVLHQGKTEAFFYELKSGTDSLSEDDPAKYEKTHYKDLPPARQAELVDALHVPLTSEMTYALGWRIALEDLEQLRNFVTNVSPKEGRNRAEEVRKRLEDITGSVLQAVLGHVTLAHAEVRIPLLSRLVKEEIEKVVGETSHLEKMDECPWGVNIVQGLIKGLTGGRRINESRANAGAAENDKVAEIARAEGAKKAQELKADADAYAKMRGAEASAYEEKMRGQGERDYLQAVAESMSTPEGRYAAALGAAERVLPNAKLVLGNSTGAMADIIALGAGVVQAMTEKGPSST